MAFRITKAEDLKGVNLPEDIRLALEAELAPQGLRAAGKAPWQAKAQTFQEYRAEEYAVLRDIYMELHRPQPDIERLRKLVKERLRDLG